MLAYPAAGRRQKWAANICGKASRALPALPAILLEPLALPSTAWLQSLHRPPGVCQQWLSQDKKFAEAIANQKQAGRLPSRRVAFVLRVSGLGCDGKAWRARFCFCGFRVTGEAILFHDAYVEAALKNRLKSCDRKANT